MPLLHMNVMESQHTSVSATLQVKLYMPPVSTHEACPPLGSDSIECMLTSSSQRRAWQLDNFLRSIRLLCH